MLVSLQSSIHFSIHPSICPLACLHPSIHPLFHPAGRHWGPESEVFCPQLWDIWSKRSVLQFLHRGPVWGDQDQDEKKRALPSRWVLLFLAFTANFICLEVGETGGVPSRECLHLPSPYLCMSFSACALASAWVTFYSSITVDICIATICLVWDTNQVHTLQQWCVSWISFDGSLPLCFFCHSFVIYLLEQPGCLSHKASRSLAFADSVPLVILHMFPYPSKSG